VCLLNVDTEEGHVRPVVISDIAGIGLVVEDLRVPRNQERRVEGDTRRHLGVELVPHGRWDMGRDEFRQQPRLSNAEDELWTRSANPRREPETRQAHDKNTMVLFREAVGSDLG
jgi:hypothetical protein